MTQTDIWSESYISDINETEMDSFKNLVINDIKSSISEDEKNILLSNLQLWNYHLQLLRRDIELQISCQKAKVKIQTSLMSDANEEQLSQIKTFINEQDKWRMSALKFLSNIEKRSLYVKLLLSEVASYSVAE